MRGDVDMTRIIRLHRKFHGLPVQCAIRRYRAQVAERQARGVQEVDQQPQRDDEPSRYPHIRSGILAQARDETPVAG